VAGKNAIINDDGCRLTIFVVPCGSIHTFYWHAMLGTHHQSISDKEYSRN